MICLVFLFYVFFLFGDVFSFNGLFGWCVCFFKRLSGWFVWWCFLKWTFWMICLVFFPPNPMKLSIKLWLMVDDYLWFWGCMICFLFFWWCCFSFLRVVVVLFLTTWSWSSFLGGWLWGLMVVFLRAVAVLVLLGIMGFMEERGFGCG